MVVVSMSRYADEGDPAGRSLRAGPTGAAVHHRSSGDRRRYFAAVPVVKSSAVPFKQ
jgi:hypothetical protein